MNDRENGKFMREIKLNTFELFEQLKYGKDERRYGLRVSNSKYILSGTEPSLHI